MTIIKKQIARSYSSIGELYMTDLCFEPDAESQCEAAIQQSLVACPDNLDALQAYASFRLSQSRPADASELIEAVYAKTKPLRDQINSRSVLEELSEESTFPGTL